MVWGCIERMRWYIDVANRFVNSKASTTAQEMFVLIIHLLPNVPQTVMQWEGFRRKQKQNKKCCNKVIVP